MIKARYKTYRLEGFIVSCGTCGYKSVIYIRTFLREWGFAVNFMTVAPSIDTKLNIRHLILLGSIIYGAIHGRTRLLCNKNQWLWLIGLLACYASFRPVTEGTNPFIARNTKLTFNFQAWGCIWYSIDLIWFGRSWLIKSCHTLLSVSICKAIVNKCNQPKGVNDELRCQRTISLLWDAQTNQLQIPYPDRR